MVLLLGWGYGFCESRHAWALAPVSEEDSHLHWWLRWLLEGLLVGRLDQGPDVAVAGFGFPEEVVDDLGRMD